MLFAKARGKEDFAELIDKYWGNNISERREKLIPFFWKTFAEKGQVYGNRGLGSNVNVKNRYWFSYPGYNEIFYRLSGYLINSNDYPANPNITLREFFNQQPGYKNSVAVFTSWVALQEY